MQCHPPRKEYDLERRTLEFAKTVIRLCKKVSNDIANRELIRQVVRSGGSVGANYREANEALGKKDKKHRIRITRKECKETSYWLDLLSEHNPQLGEEIAVIRIESRELRNILTAILKKID